MTTGERSEPEIFEMCMQKYTLIMLKMLFSEMYILTIQGGLDPPPPSRSAPGEGQIVIDSKKSTGLNEWFDYQ